MYRLLILTGMLLLAGNAAAQDWTTYRGNSRRTGNTDGKPGPSTPKILWAQKANESFIAAPVPLGNQLLISGLGAFNVSTFYCLDTDPAAKQRVAWSKTTPVLKIPTVSSPAVADGKIIFGDGMHQTDGAILHCLRVDGRPLWQSPQPGKLVHLEGAPTVAGNLAYIGGGAAGVICVDLNRVSLEGKELPAAEIQKLIDAKWKDMLAKYEVEKKKDPDFAIPPNEDQLPKPAPHLLWQAGQQKWHVDAPVNVSGDKVLVASAFLDKEQVGDRALHCLDSKTGKSIWRTALPMNPWGGASVNGSLVVVSTSTIGYYPAEIKGAKGSVIALNLADGKEKWAKDVQGGVVGSVALTDQLAICTATDGKVRAFDVNSGERAWVYDAKAPFFASPAVVGDVAYVGDLNGVVHAISVKDGNSVWKLDIGAQAPGMIYASPIVHGGRLYVATCNVEGAYARQPTVIVCIGQ
jgi:outer membrane protein assembly factor BamB